MAVDARFVHWWGDISNATLLMVAVLHKREGVVRWLLEMGASCGATDEIGWKAVHYVLEDPVEERSKEVLLGKRLVLYEGKWESGVVEREGVRVYVLEGRMFRIAVMLNEYYRNNGAKVRV
jgi:hypothetical protein